MRKTGTEVGSSKTQQSYITGKVLSKVHTSGGLIGSLNNVTAER